MSQNRKLSLDTRRGDGTSSDAASSRPSLPVRNHSVAGSPTRPLVSAESTSPTFEEVEEDTDSFGYEAPASSSKPRGVTRRASLGVPLSHTNRTSSFSRSNSFTGESSSGSSSRRRSSNQGSVQTEKSTSVSSVTPKSRRQSSFSSAYIGKTLSPMQDGEKDDYFPDKKVAPKSRSFSRRASVTAPKRISLPHEGGTTSKTSLQSLGKGSSKATTSEAELDIRASPRTRKGSADGSINSRTKSVPGTAMRGIRQKSSQKKPPEDLGHSTLPDIDDFQIPDMEDPFIQPEQDQEPINQSEPLICKKEVKTKSRHREPTRDTPESISDYPFLHVEVKKLKDIIDITDDGDDGPRYILKQKIDVRPRPYSATVDRRLTLASSIIEYQKDELRERMYQLQESLQETKKEIRENQNHTKYYLEEQVEFLTDFHNAMERSIYELVTDCSTIITGHLNKYLEDIVTGESNIFSISAKFKKEMELKELLEIGI